MLLEQAIHESLQDRGGPHRPNEDAEFERMLQQVMKDSKQEHEIQQRRQKEEEL